MKESLTERLRRKGFKPRQQPCLFCRHPFAPLPPDIGNDLYCSIGCELRHKDGEEYDDDRS